MTRTQMVVPCDLYLIGPSGVHLNNMGYCYITFLTSLLVPIMMGGSLSLLPFLARPHEYAAMNNSQTDGLYDRSHT